MREIKWSQWGPHTGMIRCGRADYNQLMKWMKDLGEDARKCLMNQEKPHAVYGRKIYSELDEIEEIRFYCDTYMTDQELDDAARSDPRSVMYAVHKME